MMVCWVSVSIVLSVCMPPPSQHPMGIKHRVHPCTPPSTPPVPAATEWMNPAHGKDCIMITKPQHVIKGLWRWLRWVLIRIKLFKYFDGHSLSARYISVTDHIVDASNPTITLCYTTIQQQKNFWKGHQVYRLLNTRIWYSTEDEQRKYLTMNQTQTMAIVLKSWDATLTTNWLICLQLWG